MLDIGLDIERIMINKVVTKGSYGFYANITQLTHKPQLMHIWFTK